MRPRLCCNLRLELVRNSVPATMPVPGQRSRVAQWRLHRGIVLPIPTALATIATPSVGVATALGIASSAAEAASIAAFSALVAAATPSVGVAAAVGIAKSAAVPGSLAASIQLAAVVHLHLILRGLLPASLRCDTSCYSSPTWSQSAAAPRLAAAPTTLHLAYITPHFTLAASRGGTTHHSRRRSTPPRLRSSRSRCPRRRPSSRHTPAFAAALPFPRFAITASTIRLAARDVATSALRLPRFAFAAATFTSTAVAASIATASSTAIAPTLATTIAAAVANSIAAAVAASIAATSTAATSAAAADHRSCRTLASTATPSTERVTESLPFAAAASEPLAVSATAAAFSSAPSASRIATAAAPLLLATFLAPTSSFATSALATTLFSAHHSATSIAGAAATPTSVSVAT